MISMLYPVHETFYSFQGEGVHMGRPAFFIRLYGCPVKCPWCDSAGAWHPQFKPDCLRQVTAEEIALEAQLSLAALPRPHMVVLTGGEPTIFDLNPLTEALRALSLPVHLETCGAFEFKGVFSWVTLSPKKWKPPLPVNVLHAHEFKIIVETPEDIPIYLKMISIRSVLAPVWLHPEWSHREDPEVLGAIIHAVKTQGRNIRAGWQIHKPYQVDRQDLRSQPSVPLGGDPEKGY